jgi:hypothetical protein
MKDDGEGFYLVFPEAIGLIDYTTGKPLRD